MTLYAVDDQLQETTSDTCGIFQLYFYKNLFDPLEQSQIIEHEKLARQTIEKILNEISSRDKASNEEKMEDFKEECLHLHELSNHPPFLMETEPPIIRNRE